MKSSENNHTPSTGENAGKRPKDAADSEAGTIRIKNMVCDRCIMTVEELLRERGYHIERISLGEAVVKPPPDGEQLAEFGQALADKGFELTRDRREELVTTIKSELITYLGMIEDQNDPPLISEYLAKKLHKTYPTLSRSFSASEGISIEKYLIQLRIERVKELLSYEERTLSEIAWQLGYSSVQHLSAQFKTVTGMSVSEYKNGKNSLRQNLDSIR